MAKQEACCDTSAGNKSGFQLEAVVSVDERGQMVLPKDLRERMGISPGEKLTVVSMEKDGQVCCLSLMKTEVLTGMVKDFMEPMMSGM